MPRECSPELEDLHGSSSLSMGGMHGDDMTLDWFDQEEGDSHVRGGSRSVANSNSTWSNHQLILPDISQLLSNSASLGMFTGAKYSGKKARKPRGAARNPGGLLSIPTAVMKPTKKVQDTGNEYMTMRKWGESGKHFKQGKFSNVETAIVVEAVETYATQNHVSVERLCQEGAHKGDLKGAWIRIAECLPDRTVQSIYRHGIRKLHGCRRGPWSNSEIDMLRNLVARHGKKWRLIERLLGRHADQCRDKYREILHTPSKGAWQRTEEEMLVKLVEENMVRSGGSKAEMQWADVSQKIGTRGRVACMKKWDYIQGKQLERRAQCDGESRVTIELALAKDVLHTGAMDESEVVWTKLPYHRAALRWREMRKIVPRSMDMREAAKHVIEHLENRVIDERPSSSSSLGIGSDSGDHSVRAPSASSPREQQRSKNGHADQRGRRVGHSGGSARRDAPILAAQMTISVKTSPSKLQPQGLDDDTLSSDLSERVTVAAFSNPVTLSDLGDVYANPSTSPTGLARGVSQPHKACKLLSGGRRAIYNNGGGPSAEAGGEHRQLGGDSDQSAPSSNLYALSGQCVDSSTGFTGFNVGAGGGVGTSKKKKKRSKKRKNREDMDRGAQGHHDQPSQPLSLEMTADGINSEAPSWDALNLSCDQSMVPDSLGLHLPDSFGLGPSAGALIEPATDTAERRSRKVMRMVGRAIADD